MFTNRKKRVKFVIDYLTNCKECMDVGTVFAVVGKVKFVVMGCWAEVSLPTVKRRVIVYSIPCEIWVIFGRIVAGRWGDVAIYVVIFFLSSRKFGGG